MYSDYEAQTERRYHDGEEAAAMGQQMALYIQAVLDYWGADTFASLNRYIYKGTDCGASLGVRLWDGSYVWNGDERLRTIQPGDVAALGCGSIVEGVDEYVEHEFLDVEPYLDTDDDTDEATGERYADDFFKLVEGVEDAAQEIWNRTHGCEDCGLEDEWGFIEVNPDCKTCGGEGTVI